MTWLCPLAVGGREKGEGSVLVTLCAPLCHPESTQVSAVLRHCQPDPTYTSPTPLPSEMEGLRAICKALQCQESRSESRRQVTHFRGMRQIAALNYFLPRSSFIMVHHFCCMSVCILHILTLPCASSTFHPPFPFFVCFHNSSWSDQRWL